MSARIELHQSNLSPTLNISVNNRYTISEIDKESIRNAEVQF